MKSGGEIDINSLIVVVSSLIAITGTSIHILAEFTRVNSSS